MSELAGFAHKGKKEKRTVSDVFSLFLTTIVSYENRNHK